MKTKAKKFSHKLLALIMAVLMAATCFTGVMTSYAASSDIKYADSDVEYNDLAWNILSDEQVATAILDYADSMLPMLKEMEPEIAKMVNSADIPVISVNYDINARQLTAKFALTTLATVTIKLGSVDELLETINSVQSVLDGGLVGLASGLGIDLGFIENLDLSAVNNMRRSNTSSCDIVRGILGIIYDNNDAVIGSLLRGDFSTGVLGLDMYQTLGDLVGGIDSGYQSNFVYNFVQALLFRYTEWFTDEEIAAYKAGTETFVYDDVLLDKMTVELLDKINVLVTYADGTTSASRRAEIDAQMETGKTYAEAAAALGYDPNLVYSDENTGNILLFAYGDDMLHLDKGDSLFTFGYRALDFAWDTVLKDTINLVHVNNSVERGHGSNFDNAYYYWARENKGWSTSDVASNYTEEKITAWANAVYESYDASSAEEFLGWVEENYEFDRTVAEDAAGNWRDIDEEQLFNKLRYSPLADYYFDIQTGPINLYFSQTGTPNLEAFFETYGNYTSLVGGLNDCLVAAVKDFFPDSDNVYVDAKGDTDLPEMATINPTGAIGSTEILNITNTLVGNALKVVQYVADTTDQNILNGFYKANGDGAVLTESNLESAMIPLLVACIGQVNLSGYKLEDMIHPEDWDRCQDAEAVAFIALREYLSYVLPNKDYNTLANITEDKITADFETCILPMARDAIIYVIEPYVPVTDASGNQWTAAGDTIDQTTSIFTLLNSVVCYYADNYTFTNSKRSGENALGVASLLGVCDTNGNSLVSMDNTLWENFDIIINELLPVVGTLQGTGYGNVDSEALIMDDVVNGILNIADTNASTGLQGVSNFIYRLLTFISAEPIQTTPVTLTVYNLVKDLLNGLFGPRYSGQEWVPVPDASSATPWDDVLQKDVVAGPSSGNPGVLGKAINNFVEFSGFGYNGVSTYPDSILSGLTFAITAVNSFVNIMPAIGDHQLQMATASFESPVLEGCASGSSYTTAVSITNNSTGVNVAYVDGMSDTVEQMSRYYIKVTGARITGTNSASTVTSPSSALIAPGESLTINANAYYTPAAEEYSSEYTVTFTYDICDASGNTLYSNLTTNAYQYLTGESSWVDVVYPYDRRQTDGTYWLASGLETSSAGATTTVGGYNAITSQSFSNGRLIGTVPEYVVVGSDNLSEVNHYALRIVNTTNSWFGSDAGMDGVYYYDTGSVYDDASGTNVTIGIDNPVPVINKETGDIIKYGTFDISYNNGESWDNNGGAGYTQSEVDTKLNELSQSGSSEDVNNFRSRDHVAVTFAEARANGIVAAYHVNEKSGLYEYVYLKNGSGSYHFDTLLGNISCRGPVDGFYINSGKQTISKGRSAYFTYLNYDGVTEVPYTNVETNIAFFSSSGSGSATFTFRVCDTSNASEVSDRFEELQTLMAQYKVEDFIDVENVYNVAHDALISALSATASPITPQTAVDLSDKTELAYDTATSTSAAGDKAYRPLTSAEYEQLSTAVKALIYIDTVDGQDYYYLDEEHSRPVYSTVELSASDVTDGHDAYGMPVTTVEGADGYYIANEIQYATEWDTTTYAPYPYKASTGEQATDADGNKLYDQVQWAYYNANGYRVSSNSTWVIKVPDTSYQLIEVGGENGDTRGIYTKNNDRLEYTIEYVTAAIDPTIGQTLLTDVSLVRNGLNETNFEIVTYNKMVDMAKTIESQYTITVAYDKVEDKLDEDGNVVYDEKGDAVKETNSYTETVNFNSYSRLLADETVTITSSTVNSTLSSTQVAEYKRLFNIFLGEVVERGYLGDRLEEEVACASNNAYADLAVSGITETEDGYKDYTTAAVSKTAASADPEFGVFNNDGVLVNDGDVVYPADLWANYVESLAKAVDLAQLGNGSYAHKTPDNYDPDADDYEARATSVYTAKIDLQAAEIALENTKVLTLSNVEGGTVTVNGEAYTKPIALTTDEYVELDAEAEEGYTFAGFQIGDELITETPYSLKMDKDITIANAVFESEAASDITVSGTVMVATNLTGTAYTGGLGGINILANGEVVGTSASDGTFTVTVPVGITELVFQGESTIDRTVTLSGTVDVADAVVPVVMCDYNRDGYINSIDLSAFISAMSEYNVYADFNCDAYVNSVDLSGFVPFQNNTVTYEEINLG